MQIEETRGRGPVLQQAGHILAWCFGGVSMDGKILSKWGRGEFGITFSKAF